MHDVVQRNFTPDGEKVKSWDRYTLHLPVIPEDLVQLKVEPEEMSHKELKNFAERIRQAGGRISRWQVDIHGKIALPLAGFIIVIFGLPISAVRRRSGAIVGVTLSLLITFIYFGIMQVGKVLGYKEIIDPFTAACMGNILFFVIGGLLYLRTPK